MEKILTIFYLILVNSSYLFSNGPPEEPPLQPHVVTPYVPKEFPPVRYNPGHR